MRVLKLIFNKEAMKRLTSGSDLWVGGLGCNATVVVTVTRHHDVTLQSPASAPT